MSDQERLDRFAAAALTGLLAGVRYEDRHLQFMVERSGELAEAMLTERKRPRMGTTQQPPQIAPPSAPLPAAAHGPPPAPTAPSGLVSGGGAAIYAVASSSKTGPTQSSPQEYLNFKLVSDAGHKLMLRFYMNSATQHKEFMAMFAKFLNDCGTPIIKDTDDLNGCKLTLHGVDRKVSTLAGLASVGKALAIKDGTIF